MHKKQIHHAMHKNHWSDEEIKKTEKILKKLKKDSTIIKTGKLHYFSNLILLLSVVIISNLSIIPAIILTNPMISFIISAIIGLVFGITMIPTIIFLEDYHEKHENLIGNIIILIVLITVDYFMLNFILGLLGSIINPLMHAIIYTIFFMIPSTYTFIDFERQIKKSKK